MKLSRNDDFSDVNKAKAQWLKTVFDNSHMENDSLKEPQKHMTYKKPPLHSINKL